MFYVQVFCLGIWIISEVFFSKSGCNHLPQDVSRFFLFLTSYGTEAHIAFRCFTFPTKHLNNLRFFFYKICPNVPSCTPASLFLLFYWFKFSFWRGVSWWVQGTMYFIVPDFWRGIWITSWFFFHTTLSNVIASLNPPFLSMGRSTW